MSIFHFTDPFSFYSKAPFHPTPAGQQAIAEGVIAGGLRPVQHRHPGGHDDHHSEHGTEHHDNGTGHVDQRTTGVLHDDERAAGINDVVERALTS